MLYIVNKNGDALSRCAQRATKGDAVLLTENAVLAALCVSSSPITSLVENGVRVYSLTPDMQVRGVDVAACFESINCVDYSGFVDLVKNHNPIRSCF